MAPVVLGRTRRAHVFFVCESRGTLLLSLSGSLCALSFPPVFLIVMELLCMSSNVQ